MMKFVKNKKSKRLTSIFMVMMMFASGMPGIGTVQANDSYPFTDAPQGKNQPNVSGYTASQIADWSPETDPYAEMLRSHVPLQERVAPLADTQANPNLPADIQVMNAAGDYGNAFIENAPYTDKFARYHFNFWQYTDMWTPWHGSATAYVTPEMWDETGKKEWNKKTFEFGIINIPDPTYTDAAHKNGVMVLAGTFFSYNDRGPQTYKQMLYKETRQKPGAAEGVMEEYFPVAEKLIEMAKYYGYDGYFFNQEENATADGGTGSSVNGNNVALEDIPLYIEFLQAIRDGGLYIQWYNSLNTITGNNVFDRILEKYATKMLIDDNKVVSDSLFVDYGATSAQVDTATKNLDALNAANGTDYDLYDVYFYGLEAGSTGVDGAHWASANNNYSRSADENGIPRTSLGMLGSDFVHSDLDRDMQLSGDSDPDWGKENFKDYKHNTDYQWMATVREQLWWSGGKIDPTNPVAGDTDEWNDVYAPGGTSAGRKNEMQGIAKYVPEKSAIGGTNFFTNFNVGRGLNYYDKGTISTPGEWSNMSLQDTSPTWQWWQDTAGNRLNVDFDYGSGVKIDPTRQNYNPIGAYNGGNSLVVNGELDADVFLRLYKTELSVNANSKIDITYKKSSDDDNSMMNVGLIFKDDTNTVVKLPVEDSNKKTVEGWVTKTLDLSSYSGKDIAVIGFAFDADISAIADYQMNIGQIRVYDDSVEAPAAPTGLTIDKSFTDTDEMYVKWDMEEDYSKVVMYKVYVNDHYVGGRYDGVYYIKNLPAKSGTIKVVPVGSDGKEGTPATVDFDLTKAVSNINANSAEDGTLNVTWDENGLEGTNVKVEYDALIPIDGTPIHMETAVALGTGTATFSGLKTNGDDYRITITVDNNSPVSLTGRLADTICEPYAEAYSYDPAKARYNFPMPTTRDWHHIYVEVNGEPMAFQTAHTAINPAPEYIIRGYSRKTCLYLRDISMTDKVTVVMEDYTGNKSEALELTPHVTDEFFTDPVFYDWVLNHVGDGTTILASDIDAYTGTIDLSGLQIENYKGLDQFKNAVDVVLSGNDKLTDLSGISWPAKMKTLDLSGCTNLTSIPAGTFSTYSDFREINITGCSAIETLGLNDANLAKIVYGDTDTFPNMLCADLSGSRFDLTEGSPEANLASMLDAVVGGRTPKTGEGMTNLALHKVPVESMSAATNPERLFDGLYTAYAALTANQYITLEFDTPQKVEQINIVNQLINNGTRGGKLEVSNDGENWTEILSFEVTMAVQITQDIDPANQQSAKYYRYTSTTPQSSGRILELQLLGKEVTDPFLESGSQNPLPDYSDLIDQVVVHTETMELSNVLGDLKTVNGNLISELEGNWLSEGFKDFSVRIKDKNDNILDGTEFNGLALGLSNGPFTIEYMLDDVVLHKRIITVTTNTKILEGAITTAEEIDTSLYTENSAKTLTDMIANGKELLEEVAEMPYTAALQANLDKAAQDIYDAMIGLVSKVDSIPMLKNAIEAGKAVDLSLYTGGSGSLLKNAITKAENLLKDVDGKPQTAALKAQINDAVSTIFSAIANLVPAIDVSVLNESIKSAEAIDTASFKPASVTALTTAIKNGKAVRDGAIAATPTKTQKDVDQAVLNILNAQKGLVKSLADKTKLVSAIKKADKVKKSQYTAKSYAAMKSALDTAKDINNKEIPVTQQGIVNSAVSSLNNAYAALVSAPAKKGGTYTVGSLKYKVLVSTDTEKTVTVTGPKSKSAKTVTVPATVKIGSYTYKVTAISGNAFKGMKKLTKATVGKNVTTIGKNAFNGNKKLATIDIKSKVLNEVGSNAFKGIKSNANIKVPSSQKKVYQILLKGKGQSKNVKIK